MTISMECKKCEAIYHKNIEKHQEQTVIIICPFCGEAEEITIREDDI